MRGPSGSSSSDLSSCSLLVDCVGVDGLTTNGASAGGRAVVSVAADWKRTPRGGEVIEAAGSSVGALLVGTGAAGGGSMVAAGRSVGLGGVTVG